MESDVATAPVVSSVLQAFGMPTLLCVLGSRMFFNLKEAAEHGVNVGTNWSSHLENTMQFEDSPDEDLYVNILLTFRFSSQVICPYRHAQVERR